VNDIRLNVNSDQVTCEFEVTVTRNSVIADVVGVVTRIKTMEHPSSKGLYTAL
jgi:hypothetical protein